MQITSVPLNQAEVTERVTRWLIPILESPTLDGGSPPTEARCYIYVDNHPVVIIRGAWQIAEGEIYMAGASRSVEPLTKLTILSAIASHHKCTEDPLVAEKIVQRLVVLLAESAKSVYGNIITSLHRPTRLAINQQELQVAAEINGSWILTNGAPIAVNDQWIIMDF